MNDHDEATAQAYSVADELIAEYPHFFPIAHHAQVKNIIALAWLRGWIDSGHAAIQIIDAYQAEQS